MPPSHFTNKTAIVTGGARGIGLAIARRLLADGARCCLWDIDSSALAAATAELASGQSLHTVRVDVTDPSQVKAAADETAAKFGGIDILVNNAGIAGATKKTWELTPEEWM